MIRIGITGAAGYTAGELLRLLVNHPEAQVAAAWSESHAGEPVWQVHEGLFGETDLCFCPSLELNDLDVLFLCSGHGKSTEFWASRERPAGLRVIDLAQDYRDEHDGYVYGLPEYNRERLCKAQLVANPGCFATAIQLALLPLAAAGLLQSDVEATGITGSTGAGQKPTATTHFSWRADNLSSYKVFEHQHLQEINRTLHLLQPGFGGSVNFVPMRGDFTRGIFATAYTDCPLTESEAQRLYADYYREAVFTHVFPGEADLKQAVNTNKCLLSVRKRGNKIVVTSVLDNLLKGASGQAVQNMNLMCGLPEETGLRLKASGF
ncbi:MAG: N-acetyl-gamma-glutamyl-phosphate reductase [Paludibacteraceae bacterium]|nr:N-acetyl-gamma-glutamyl-phosphate reductase [Paludibacteraceae bacterium]